MKTLFKIIVCICITVSISKAQPYFDVLAVQTSSASQPVSNNAEKEQFNLNWFSANFNFPLELDKKNLFVTTLGYEQFAFKDKNSPLSQTFNSIYVPLTFLHTWKDTTWTTSFTYIPKVNSYSPVHVSDNTMQHGGAMVVSHIVNDHFKYSFGGYYNREFFGNYFLPLLGIEWKASNRLRVFGLLPNDMTADYKISKTLHTGFAYKGIATSFRYKPASTADYLKMEEGQLKLFADFYLTKTLVLNIEGGVIAARSYSLQYKTPVEKPDFNVRESSIFKIGLYYRVWM